MRNRSVIDSIDDYKSIVYLYIYRGGGLDPLQTNLPNLLSAQDTALRSRGPSGPQARTVRGAQFSAQHMPPAFWRS
jgi:hypothetical protein